MIRIFWIGIVILGFSCRKSSKESDRFTVYKFDLNISSDSIEFDKWKKRNIDPDSSNHSKYNINISGYNIHCDYVDSLYAIRRGCMGEFGGEVYFFNLKNDSVYFLPVTCALQISRIDGEYHILAELAHLRGRSSLRVVSNPKLLPGFPIEQMLSYWKLYHNTWLDSVSFDRKRLENQRILIDTFGTLFDLYFRKNGTDYIIYGDSVTMLGKLVDGRLSVLDTLIGLETWTYKDWWSNVVNDRYLHYSFSNIPSEMEYGNYRNGDIYVMDDTIVIAWKLEKVQR